MMVVEEHSIQIDIRNHTLTFDNQNKKGKWEIPMVLLRFYTTVGRMVGIMGRM